MRRIAVINQKGGVGKTTTTANLGAALARSGQRVLIIDLDPQAHLTLHYGVELADDQPSIYELLTGAMPVEKVSVAARENLTFVPADIDLAAAEVELISVTGREVILREALRGVDDDYDVMLIDCPPSLGVLTINALVAAREVIIPLQAQFFALQGLSKLLDTVTLVRQRINAELTVGGVVLCMHESVTRLAGEVVEDLTRFLEVGRGTEVPWAEARIYETRIRRNIKLAEASSFGKSIFEYAPRSHGAADYAALSVELFGSVAVLVEPTSEAPDISARPHAGIEADPVVVEAVSETTPVPPRDAPPSVPPPDEAPPACSASVEPFRPETLVASALLGRVGDHGAW